MDPNEVGIVLYIYFAGMQGQSDDDDVIGLKESTRHLGMAAHMGGASFRPMASLLGSLSKSADER